MNDGEETQRLRHPYRLGPQNRKFGRKIGKCAENRASGRQASGARTTALAKYLVARRLFCARARRRAGKFLRLRKNSA
jgi:hypothetical protein